MKTTRLALISIALAACGSGLRDSTGRSGAGAREAPPAPDEVPDVPTAAAAGIPDPTFGTDGIACVGIESSYAGVRQVSVGSGPTVRLLGDARYDEPVAYQWAAPIAQLGSGGVLDGSYGTGGVAMLPRPVAWTSAYSVSPDGAVALGGVSADDAGALVLTLLRVRADGSPDPTFGVDGWVSSRVPGAVWGSVAAMVFDAAGNLIVVGTQAGGSNEQMMVARVLTDGQLDPSFDGDGFASAVIGTGYYGTGTANARAVALQPDGRIVVAGQSLKSDGATSLVTALAVRYQLDGSLDPSFHDDGVAWLGRGYVAAVRVEPDEGLFFAGLDVDNTAPPANVAVLARLGADGAPRPGFGVNGRVTTSLSPPFPPADGAGVSSFVERITLTREGDALFVGGRYSQTGISAVLSRVKATGELDPAFGQDGQVVVPDASGWDVVVGPGGELVVALERQGPEAMPSLCALRLR